MQTLIENFKKECEFVANGKNLKDVPMEFRVPDLIMVAVKTNGLNLQHAPKQYVNQQIVDEAVKNDGWSVCYAPPEFVNQNVCDAACMSNPCAFRFIPNQFKTYQLCKKAIENHIENIKESMPDGIIDRGICENVLKKDGNFIDAKAVKPFIDQELCLLAAQNGAYLDSIPKEYRNYEVFMAIAKNGKISLGYYDNPIPSKMRTSELYLEICINNPANLKHVHPAIKTGKFCMEVVKNNKSNNNPLIDIPDKFITGEMLDAAIENGSCKLILNGIQTKILKMILTKELVEKAFNLHVDNIANIPKQWQTENMWIKVFENESDIKLHNVPVNFRTEKVCQSVINNKKLHDLSLVPNEVKTREMCLSLFDNPARLREHIVEFVPMRLMTQDFYAEFAKKLAGHSICLKAWQTKAKRAKLNIDVDIF